MQLFSRAWNKAKRIWKGTDLAKAIKFNQQLRKFRKFFSIGNSPKMLVFGDSVACYVARDDISKKSLEVLFKEQSRDIADTFVVAGRAYQSEIYFNFCRLISQLSYRPQLVIVPINLRSFSPSWDLNPKLQLLENIIKLRNSYDGRQIFSLRIDRNSPTANTIFRSVPLQYPGKSLLAISEYIDVIKNKPSSEKYSQWSKRLDYVFTYHYMYPIYQQNRKLISLCKTVELLRELNIPVLLYFTPINYQAGLKYVGERFLEGTNNNIDIITENLQKSGILNNGDYANSSGHLANYAYTCDACAFFTPHNATEHLRFEERLDLVNNLLATARKMIID